MQHIVNAQGLNMPNLGLGTWPMLGEECTRAVEQALTLGYRHVDTAQNYGNEASVGRAIRASGIAREEIVAVVQRVLREGPECLGDLAAGVRFWADVWEAVHLEEIYVEIAAPASLRVAPNPWNPSSTASTVGSVLG